ncbi:protein mesh-like [Ischnura elegans]|uniref:protein mesh-like n=1 Tax=Ischnura elegans TaxID=197161 RepID=UPI001ED86B57|nr:protein mesh-like [Ischnura elegans]
MALLGRLGVLLASLLTLAVVQAAIEFPTRGQLLPGVRTVGNNAAYGHPKIKRAIKGNSISHDDGGYVLTEERLREIRSEFMYWYSDQGGDQNHGDYQTEIHTSNPQIQKNLNFQLPFYGFRYNYVRVSLNGYLEFSDPPEFYKYPLVFPVLEWPQKNDPAFIGIFYSKCRMGSLTSDDTDRRIPGVYFRAESDLDSRNDQFGVELRERLKWDIREGVIGANTFSPKHALIATWKNVSFAGGIDSAIYKTNTFQIVLATDEVSSYAIFNYQLIDWTTHTEAGGDTVNGQGGVPAFVGFNAGNATQSFEYFPYSQSTSIRKLTTSGMVNGFPGRHIFPIDEEILPGSCDIELRDQMPLLFSPQTGNMLGGTIVNITGPCFLPDDKVFCTFGTETVQGTMINRNRAMCVQPFLLQEGYVKLTVTLASEYTTWVGKYFIETPATATEKVFFPTSDVHQINPPEIKIEWDRFNLTSNLNAPVQISLWGYKEANNNPQLRFIDTIEDGTINSGEYTIVPSNYWNRSIGPELSEFEFGLLLINLSRSTALSVSPSLWSKPIPLGWYFNAQWESVDGKEWPQKRCDSWIKRDSSLNDFESSLPQCPCTLEKALLDKGRYMPDLTCDKDSNPLCYYNRGAVHCVKTGMPSLTGSEQQCCYDMQGRLMLTYDNMWGSKPARSHNLGLLPWNEAGKVPTLSQWYNDKIPFHLCCLWQGRDSEGCKTYLTERRPTQNCSGYAPPAIALVFGDPHFITFDGAEYTFNGKGEFVLLRANTNKNKLDIQGRFEQPQKTMYGEVRATQLTSIVARENMSAVIEVRVRPPVAQWRYQLDVLADGKKIYFDRPSLKVQHFEGVTVYTPTNILNQSQVIIMFQSGAGVEVLENNGYMAARIYLPHSLANQTRGLLGNWSSDVMDDFTLPDGSNANVSLDDLEGIHKNFGIHWILSDENDPTKGRSLFQHDAVKTSGYYTDITFVPEWKTSLDDLLPLNRSDDRRMAKKICGYTQQCIYDYALSLDVKLAQFSKYCLDEFNKIKESIMK